MTRHVPPIVSDGPGGPSMGSHGNAVLPRRRPGRTRTPSGRGVGRDRGGQVEPIDSFSPFNAPHTAGRVFITLETGKREMQRIVILGKLAVRLSESVPPHPRPHSSEPTSPHPQSGRLRRISSIDTTSIGSQTTVMRIPPAPVVPSVPSSMAPWRPASSRPRRRPPSSPCRPRPPRARRRTPPGPRRLSVPCRRRNRPNWPRAAERPPCRLGACPRQAAGCDRRLM